ncbi:MAG TPA: thioredoxin family protein [Gammaproteobacteria bacterium]|nr:thioredoxin family protein [Gammaproteobacteria bacterium]
MKQIKVLGTGCRNCQTVYELVRLAAEKKGVEVELEKVEDMAEIMAWGVMSTPGVVVDGELVHAGGIPGPDDIEEWLEE